MSFNTWVEVAGCEAAVMNYLTEMQPMTVPAANTLPTLTYEPAGGLMMLIVNGTTFTPDDGSFTVSGQTLTWTSTIYSIQPGDSVVAIYTYLG